MCFIKNKNISKKLLKECHDFTLPNIFSPDLVQLCSLLCLKHMKKIWPHVDIQIDSETSVKYGYSHLSPLRNSTSCSFLNIIYGVESF